MSVMKKKLLKLSASFCLIGLLLWISDIPSVWQQIQKVDVFIILECMAALCLAQVISSLRWQWILVAEGAKIPLKKLFSSYMIGMFVNNFMPTSIGGDIIKAYDIYRWTKDASLSVVSVFFERFTGLVALILLSWIGITFFMTNFYTTSFLVGSWIFINMACIIVIMIFFHKSWFQLVLKRMEIRRLEKVGKLLRLCYDKLIAYKNRKYLVVKILIVSFPIQLVTIMIYQQISVEIGIHLPFVFFLFTVPLIILISLLPVSFGGLGVREGATICTFSVAGVPTDVALSVSLIYMSITYLVSLIGGFLMILRNTKIAEMTKIKNDFF